MGNVLEVLVTGGNGNLGSWITDHLGSLGHRVTILARTRNAFVRNRDYAFIPCDLTDSTQVIEKLKNRKFDHVIHLSSTNETNQAGYSELSLQVNTLGTRNLLQALDMGSLKGFQYFSTFHVYGKKSGTITEETPLLPCHDYATTHLFAEYYVRQFHLTEGVPYVIWRLSNSYGAPKFSDSTKWYLVLNDLSRMAFQNHEIRLNSNGKAQRDFIWMGDVCKVVSAAIDGQPALNSVFNLGSGTSWSMLDVARAVQEAYQEMYGKVLPVEPNALDKTRHDESLQYDTSKLQEKIAFKPQEKFREEAIRIFTLLESKKS